MLLDGNRLSASPLSLSSLGASLFFMALGLYLAWFWPRSIQRQIDAGEEAADMEQIIRWVRPVGILLFLYCLLEILLPLLGMGSLIRQLFGLRH